MISAELRWDRRSRNLHYIAGVVWSRIFAKILVFRNVRHHLHQFVTDTGAALPAIRKHGIAHQDHRGAALVFMADFVNSGMLDQLPRIDRTVRLVKDLCATFHIYAGSTVNIG